MGMIAARIKEGMEIRSLKQSELAKMTGISRGTLSSYLSGRYTPKQNNLLLIANALNVSEDWLAGKDVPLSRHMPGQKSVTIQVFQHISSGGFPGLAERVPSKAGMPDTEEITEMLASTGSFFGLRVTDDGMAPSICSGDVVIARKQEDGETGDIVVVSINDSEAACKRLRKYRDGIELIGNNPLCQAFDCPKQDNGKNSVKILGKVVELRRRF